MDHAGQSGSFPTSREALEEEKLEKKPEALRREHTIILARLQAIKSETEKFEYSDSTSDFWLAF